MTALGSMGHCIASRHCEYQVRCMLIFRSLDYDLEIRQMGIYLNRSHVNVPHILVSMSLETHTRMEHLAERANYSGPHPQSPPDLHLFLTSFPLQMPNEPHEGVPAGQLQRLLHFEGVNFVGLHVPSEKLRSHE
jgi:hypothetical protein